MKKYLYLTEMEWVDAWVNGGIVPIKLASSYLSHIRNGVNTPDENLIHSSNVDIKSLLDHGIKVENCKNITFKNCSSNIGIIPDILNANYYEEDGLILSFCNKKSNEICSRLNKKACVKINDIYELKQQIDSQLAIEGIMKQCEYTHDHQRNHFLKSEKDAWQDEFRIFWPILEEKNVFIDKGTAKSIKIVCK